MGGQTALNVAMELYENNLLGDVEFLGANPEAIKKGEDRHLFNEAMIKIGMDLPKSANAYTLDEAIKIAKNFSEDKAKSFINGILDRVAKEKESEKNTVLKGKNP